MTTETDTKPRTETPTGYLDFSLEIAAQWLNGNAAQALGEIVDASPALVTAVEEAQQAVKHARALLRTHSARVVVNLPESTEEVPGE
jgi:nitrate reductase assembly molybdenum cofactor insertion protein NarJ